MSYNKDVKDVAFRTTHNSAQCIHHSQSAIGKTLSAGRTPVLNILPARGKLCRETSLNLAEFASLPSPRLISRSAESVYRICAGTRNDPAVRSVRDRSLEIT